MKRRMVDRHGNTVEVASIDGRQVFIARHPNGRVLGRTAGDGRTDLTSPEQLAAAGVHLASLRAA